MKKLLTSCFLIFYGAISFANCPLPSEIKIDKTNYGYDKAIYHFTAPGYHDTCLGIVLPSNASPNLTFYSVSWSSSYQDQKALGLVDCTYIISGTENQTTTLESNGQIERRKDDGSGSNWKKTDAWNYTCSSSISSCAFVNGLIAQ